MNYTNSNQWLVMPSVLSATFFLGLATLCHSNLVAAQEKTTVATPSIEPTFFSNVRQLTFEGLRAGEGYYNSDGTLMVFQSERRPDNPFFQIYLLDLQTGDSEPISPGHGMTTCSWIHPDNNLVMFSSTHDDPEARAKQKAEFELRESGKVRPYAWSYDPTFEIYAFDRKQKTYTQLTKAEGYDAEGCYSPDGKQIVFASNRTGYDPAFADELTEEDRKRFEIDQSYLMDIYIMNADGSDVRRLTKSPGYDGGPFFSQDGKKICWRRFSVDGKSAEIFTMNVDGSDELQLTRMGAMSWAPFFHPSGKYLIFNTNVHGFDNFELYLVAADGKSLPVRVTDTMGFDALANFTHDGNKLSWTSGRTAKKDSQIFVADWNHEGALKALLNSGIVPPESQRQNSLTTASKPALPEKQDPVTLTSSTEPAKDRLDVTAFAAAEEWAKQTKPGFDAADVAGHIKRLSNEKSRASFVAGYFSALGLRAEQGENRWMQSFEYPAEISFTNCRLAETLSGESEAELASGSDWSPMPISGKAQFANRPIVFAGYGIVAPEQNGQVAYDSYAAMKVDVKDKWVLIFGGFPSGVDPARTSILRFYGDIKNKVQYAKERGAQGLIVIDAEASKLADEPVRGQYLNPESNIGVVAVNESVAESWLSSSPETVDQIKARLDSGEDVEPFEIADVKLSGNIESKFFVEQGAGVLGRLLAGEKPTPKAIMICASLDGLGDSSDSGKSTVGADAASGVAGLLEVATFLSAQQKDGKLALQQDLIFSVWPGDEMASQISAAYARSLTQPASEGTEKQYVVNVAASGAISIKDKPTTAEALDSTFIYLGKNHPDYTVVIEVEGDPQSSLSNQLAESAKKHGVGVTTRAAGQSQTPSRPLTAVIHLDRIGRLDGKVVLHGAGSSPYWSSAIESRNVVAGLPLATFNDLLFPSDASSFQSAGVPVISAFTGAHADIHAAGDTADRINAQGIASISQLMALIARGMAVSDDQLAFVAPAPKIKVSPRGGSASLGTIPSYAADVVGVMISDVRPGTPAQKAGLKPNDIIVELAGEAIEDVQAYSDLLNEIPIGKETEVVVERDGKRLKFKITPIARQR